jgi:hypothetical protein
VRLHQHTRRHATIRGRAKFLSWRVSIFQGGDLTNLMMSGYE